MGKAGWLIRLCFDSWLGFFWVVWFPFLLTHRWEPQFPSSAGVIRTDRLLFWPTPLHLLMDNLFWNVFIFGKVWVGFLLCFFFINVYFHPQSEAAAVQKDLGAAEIWKLSDRLLLHQFGTHWDAGDWKCVSDTHEYWWLGLGGSRALPSPLCICSEWELLLTPLFKFWICRVKFRILPVGLLLVSSDQSVWN